MVTKTVTSPSEERGQAPALKATCRHHWMIDPPESRTSDGECVLCRARKRFPNYLSDCLIQNDKEMFEEWLARQGRRRQRGREDLNILSETEEGV